MNEWQPLPFDDEFLTVNQILAARHYLGPIDRGFSYRDEFGVMVFANPSSRRLPQDRWLELVRWLSLRDEERRLAAVAQSGLVAAPDAPRRDNGRQL